MLTDKLINIADIHETKDESRVKDDPEHYAEGNHLTEEDEYAADYFKARNKNARKRPKCPQLASLCGKAKANTKLKV